LKTLIITAHPSSKGFTHKIAESYKLGAESVGVEVEILDLYKEPRQDFLSFENPKDITNDPLRDSYQSKIKDANDIVFIHPMWWGASPAIMKNFIDCNFASHFAFNYVNGRPVGLLKGRTASVYITCDGSIWIYRLLLLPFKIIWSLIFLGVCGFKVRRVAILDKKFKKTDLELNCFLEKVKCDAKKLV
jgi:NAD(P)H dehydrogenase (quinone)